MTTALMAVFAACTNDDFISNGQGVQDGEAALRPSVGVTLNVLEGDGTDTRLGFENVERQLLSDEILSRREAIIGAKLHLVGGATC